jgi:hypothetical protein
MEHYSMFWDDSFDRPGAWLKTVTANPPGGNKK